MYTLSLSRTVLVAAIAGLTGCATAGGAASPEKIATSSRFTTEANRNFHVDYDRLRAQEEGALGNARALVVVSGATVTLRFQGKASRWSIVGERYQTLKGLTHIPVGVTCFLLTLNQATPTSEERARLLDLKKSIASADGEVSTGSVGAEMVPVEHHLLGATTELIDDALAHGRPADDRLRAYGKAIRPDVDANLAGASGLLLGTLDAAAREMKAQVGEEAWSKLVMVITSAHQARAREVSVQYFERALGERLTEGALGEQRLVVLETTSPKTTPESVMTSHLVDQRLSALLFDDPLFLQSDVLGRYAGPYLDRLFPRAAP